MNNPIKIFENVLNYIDKNICCRTEDIKKNMAKSTGCTSYKFGSVLDTLFFTTINYYVKQRRAYFTGKYLLNNRDKSIAEVSNDFNYAEQSVFTRDLKEFFNITPSEARKINFIFPNNRLELDNNFKIEVDDMNDKKSLNENTIEYLIDLMENSEFIRDIDTIYSLFELAQKLTISARIGTGSVNHNDRKFIAKNVDRSRTNQNIIFIEKDIKKVDHDMFDIALNEYNAKQTRKDRVISDY